MKKYFLIVFGLILLTISSVSLKKIIINGHEYPMLVYSSGDKIVIGPNTWNTIIDEIEMFRKNHKIDDIKDIHVFLMNGFSAEIGELKIIKIKDNLVLQFKFKKNTYNIIGLDRISKLFSNDLLKDAPLEILDIVEFVKG